MYVFQLKRSVKRAGSRGCEEYLSVAKKKTLTEIVNSLDFNKNNAKC